MSEARPIELKEKTDSSNKKDLIVEKESSKKIDPDYDLSWLKGTSADQKASTIKCNRSAPNLKADFSDPVYKKLSKINGKINTMPMNVLVNSLRELKLETSGKKEVLIRRLKNYHKEKCLNKTVESDFDYVCVIDFEATCTENSNFSYPHEIIEFPIVLVNMKTLKIVSHFQAYCKPNINPKLTSFCKSLTGISQEQVDSADEFPQVLNQVNNWFSSLGLGQDHSFVIAADGPWDMQKFLYMQCGHSEINYPHWAQAWIDVRKLFSNWFGVKRCGILKMLDYLGLEFEGNQHCGLDDSKNIARILILLAQDGCIIKKNSWLKDNENRVF